MNLELDILKFIEYSGRIKVDNLKTLYLWASSEVNQEKILKAIETSEFNQIISSLIERNLLITEKETLYINNDVVQYLNWWQNPMDINKLKSYNFELLWIGTFTISGKPDSLEIILKEIDAKLRQSNVVQIDTVSPSPATIKTKYSLRIYGIDTTFTIDRNSFIIKSKSTVGDIPSFRNNLVEKPIERLSKDQDELAIQLAPNTAVNYYLFSMLRVVLKNTCEKFKLNLNLSELTKPRGQDTGHE